MKKGNGDKVRNKIYDTSYVLTYKSQLNKHIQNFFLSKKECWEEIKKEDFDVLVQILTDIKILQLLQKKDESIEQLFGDVHSLEDLKQALDTEKYKTVYELFDLEKEYIETEILDAAYKKRG